MPLARFHGVAFALSGSSIVVAPSASVAVRREDTGALASLFSDRDGLVGIANPTTADASGRFAFHAAALEDGYRITVTEAGSPGTEYTYRYVPMGTMAEFDNPLTSKGDLIVGTSTGAPQRKAVGQDGALLVANASESDGLEWLVPQQGSPIGDADGYVPTAQSSADEGIVFMPPALGFNLVGGYLDWSVVGSPTSTLTVQIKTWDGSTPSVQKPVFIAFRNPTAGAGTLVYRKITAATSITINSSALLGTVSNVAFRLWCVAFDDGGTIRLAIINCVSTTAGAGSGRDVTAIYPLGGWGIASATQEDDTADGAQVFYSDGAAVSSKAYATLGYATWESGLPNAGNWNSSPTRIQVWGPTEPLPGRLVQLRRTDTGAVATGTTVIPLDDSIPQNTEGDQYMSQAITPSSAANAIRFDTQASLATTETADSGELIIAVFRDSTANALKAGLSPNVKTNNANTIFHVNGVVLAGGTAEQTYKVRAGLNVAATTTFNGNSGNRNFGGVLNSYLELQEIMG